MKPPALKVGKLRFKILGTSYDLGVVELKLEERLSTPYRAELLLACEETIGLDETIGQEGLLEISADVAERPIHGLISRFAQTGRRGRFILYQAELVPQLWLLSQKQDTRIFQNQGARDIITEILSEDQIPADRTDYRLKEAYSPKDFCVQYQESDLSFLSRILENEGMWYFFEQSPTQHDVIFADSPAAYKAIEGLPAIPFKQAEGMTAQEEVIYQFSSTQTVGPSKVSQTDFNYNAPSQPLMTEVGSKKGPGLEVYMYPGNYADTDTGRYLARVRLQELQAVQETGEGLSTCALLTPGCTFTLKGHPTPSFNREYLLVSVIHYAKQPQVLEETNAPGAMSYHNEFVVIPASATFRAPRVTAKPVIQGPQTAVVMGPVGEEIYTDEQGRVKVRFHWDRGDAKNEKSSCWIRVSQFWAGEGWGAMFLPRRGQEVIVSFLNGDPDRPIITGRVYNGANPPPHALPDHKTKSTILSRSTNNSGGSNELSFEDSEGQEEVFIHAQKDMTTKVENDKSVTVGHDETLVVQNSRSKRVNVNETAQINGAKSETVVLASAENVGLAKALNVGLDYNVNVGGIHTVTVGGAMNTAVGMAQAEEVARSKQVIVGQDMSTTVKKDNTLTVFGNSGTTVSKSFTITVGDSFEISCGHSSFKMEKNGKVTLTGTHFYFEGSSDVEIIGKTVKIN